MARAAAGGDAEVYRSGFTAITGVASNFSVLPRTTPEDSEFMGAGGTLAKITP